MPANERRPNPADRKPSDQPRGENASDASLAPEAHNPEQDDEAEQAQTIADEALGRTPSPDAGDSERQPASGTDIDDDAGSTPDVVDHMNQMRSDGRIEMSAYRGERMDDDIEQGLGPQGVDDDTPRGAE